MQKLIKIGFNISYIVSLSALVFLGSVISKVTDRRSQNDKESKTILGVALSINSASADVPSQSSGSDSTNNTDGGGDCDGDDDDDDC